ncbi:Myb/SANT-like DNA-binding domain protein [Medicago truncatula]|uniref:Myb/SANT-like DNA-binding domain protein n=1 Tax=Medicago truncatula TaxID=3880 RepID=A0A072UUU6_MEDTR|nr:Myb/SANT-like DNA-binding domain protein [Medicago truncatula]
MDSLKRKVSANPPSTNNEGQSSKASWRDLKATEYFVKACLDQVSKSQRNGTCFTKKGWQCIVSQFNEQSGLNYDKENPQYAKFRDKGLPFAHQLTTLFKDFVANGEHAWAPSSGVLPNENLGNDDNDVGLDVEGSGDSEDASIGATIGFENINLNTSQGAASQSSGQKRKRVIGAEQKGKKKATPSTSIAEAVNVIAETCKSRNEAISNASIGEVMAEIQTIEAVTSDLEFHTMCCNLMMFKPAREMFVSLWGFEERRLIWLNFTSFNPTLFMRP